MSLDDVIASDPLVVPAQAQITYDKWFLQQLTVSGPANGAKSVTATWQRGTRDDGGVWTLAPITTPDDRTANTARVTIADLDATFAGMPSQANTALEAIMQDDNRPLAERLQSVILQALQAVGQAEGLL